jgi:hypothetical protein
LVEITWQQRDGRVKFFAVRMKNSQGDPKYAATSQAPGIAFRDEGFGYDRKPQTGTVSVQRYSRSTARVLDLKKGTVKMVT